MPDTIVTHVFDSIPRSGPLEAQLGPANLEATTEFHGGDLYINVRDRSLPVELELVSSVVLKVGAGCLMLLSSDNYQLGVEGGTDTRSVLYDVTEPFPTGEEDPP